MATVYVEGKPFEMDSSRNLLDACLSLKFDLPYFCWHPALGSVGACRQCAVKQYKDENDTRGKLVMACMTPVAEGARISIADPEAAAFRRMVIEGLMLNHPHDCPVCDEGGECHLQDMTLMTGHDYRRYRFEKRTFRNQNLGPLVNHEMNRCIQCYRCVRYYREYAGGEDLQAFALHDTVFFGRAAEGTLESEFSGNLVEICPTGVFTDKTLRRHYTRKWDQQFAPSICAHCGTGCNISAGERYGTLRRIVNRYNHDVNGYFLCDRGRFGYEFVNSPDRIREARLKGQPVEAETAFEAFRAMLNGGGAIGIGSPRASLEANFALRRLVGPERFYCGMEDAEYAAVRAMLAEMKAGPARIPTMREIEESDAAFVLGEDLPNTAPRVALALRQTVRQAGFRIAQKLHIPQWMDHSVREAAQKARSPLFLAVPASTRLDDIAARTFHGTPDDIARLGFAVAGALDPAAPGVADAGEDLAYLAGFIAEALRAAERPVVISGPSLRSEPVVRAAAAVARALHAAGRPAALSFTAPECNTVGLAMMDAPPLSAAFAERGETAVVLENDLYRRAPGPEVDAFFSRARHAIVLDSLPHATTARAELLLPAGTFAESDGTYVSSEGRAQRFFQVFVPQGQIQESWRYLGDAAWRNLDDVIRELAHDLPQFGRVPDAAPPASYREADEKFPRQPHRYSGRTAVLANISVHEPKPPADPDSPLNFSMEGAAVQPPPAITPFFWAPGWNSIQSVNKYQEEIAGPLHGGVPGVRLIETDGHLPRGAPAPAAFARREGEWLTVPLYHVFGSDEMSRRSPGIATLVPPPYIALNPEDAAALQVLEGEEVAAAGARLPVKILPELTRGVAGLPVGLDGLAAAAEWIPITRLT